MSALKDVARVALFALLLSSVALGETSTVVGFVRATGPEGPPVAMAGVRLTLTCGNEAPRTIASDQQGQFRFTNVPVGSCSLVTDIQGFKPATEFFNSVAAARIDLLISLELEVLYTGLTVTGRSADGDVTPLHRPAQCVRTAGDREASAVFGC